MFAIGLGRQNDDKFSELIISTAREDVPTGKNTFVSSAKANSLRLFATKSPSINRRTSDQHKGCISHLPLHPERPALPRVDLILVNVTVNAVSTESIGEIENAALVFTRIVRVADKGSYRVHSALQVARMPKVYQIYSSH